MAKIRDFYRVLRRIVFMSFLCVVSVFASAFGEDPMVSYYCGGANPVLQESAPSGYVTTPSNDLCNFGSGYYWRCSKTNWSSSAEVVYVAVAPGEVYNLTGGGNFAYECRASVDNWCPTGTHTNMIEYLFPGNEPIDYSEVASSSVPDSYFYDPDSYFSYTYNISFSYGTVGVKGVCSASGGTAGLPMHVVVSPNSNNNSYCGCKMVSYTPNGGNQTLFTGTEAVFLELMYSGVSSSSGNLMGDCDPEQCAQHCASYLSQGSSQQAESFYQPSGAVFMNNLYTACTYDVTYTCGTTTGGNSVYGQVNPNSTPVSIGGETVNIGANVSGCNINQQLSGWYCHTNTSENVPVASSNNSYSFVQPYDNVTCEAIWPSTPMHTVTYTCGSNTGGEPPSSQPNNAYGSNVNLPLVPGTCYHNDSWKFYKWLCTGDDTGNNYTITQNSLVMLAEDVTCEAEWEYKDGYLYTLVYDCGDGSGSAPAMQQVEDTANSLLVALESNTCSAPSNKQFTGWDCYVTSQGLGSISQYDVGDDYDLSSGNSTCVAHYGCSAGYDYDDSTGNCYMREYSITYDCNNSQVQQTYVDNNNGNGYFYGNTAFLWQQSGNTVGSCQIPEHKLFAGWDCYDVSGYSPSGDGLSSNDNLYHTYVTFETLYDVLADNVSCEAVWICDTENGYTLYNGECTNEYNILYRPGFHGVFDSGYGPYFISFGPGANHGGGTWGQPWSTQTQVDTHIVANDNCYEFCGWSESQNDVCGSSSILSAGTQQGDYYHTDLFGGPSSLDLYAIWGCASGCVQSGNQCVPAPATYTVTYHGGTCNSIATDVSVSNLTAGSSYTIENPECTQNSNLESVASPYPEAPSCRKFVGWSLTDPTVPNSNASVDYGNCVDTPSCSCGTTTVNNNIDLYAICDDVPHDVIYHGGNCDPKHSHDYTDSGVLWRNTNSYSVLDPADTSSLVIPSYSFQGWALASNNSGNDWCESGSAELYQELYKGNGTAGSSLSNSVWHETGKFCRDVDLYAVCCSLKLSWGLNGGSWPAGSSGNQTTCEYGAIAGATGSIIGYGQTPLQTPLRTGYTFTGWKVTGYDTP